MSGEREIACDLTVLSPAERQEHEAAIASWRGAVLVSRRQDRTVEFDLERRDGLLRTVARFIELESRCCPFFDFELRVPAEGPIALAIGGPEGAEPIVEGLATT